MARQCSTARDVSCLSCQWRQHSEWRVLNEEETRFLSRNRKNREYRTGESIFAMAEPSHGLYCMVSGTAALRKGDAEGNTALLRILYPGDTLGYRDVLLEEKRRYGAEALGPSRVCFIDKQTFKVLLDRNPALSQQFVRRIAQDMDEAHDQLVRNTTLSNRDKFVRLLHALMNRNGCTATDGSRFMQLPLSRRDLASMIGTRHETLSRIISRLEEDGVACFSGRTVHVPNPDAWLQELQRPALLD